MPTMSETRKEILAMVKQGKAFAYWLPDGAIGVRFSPTNSLQPATHEELKAAYQEENRREMAEYN